MTEDLFPAPTPDAPAAGADAPAANPEEGVFRIGEVCRLTATKAFVLRYWETEFPMLAPHKSPKGHRLYRREDIDMVFEIKRLLYEEGFTIAGARRWLESSGREGPEGDATSPPILPSGSTAARKLLADLEQELRAILTLLGSG
ncbi:MAG TPA: MerR family transcriptional regulator [Patescibacteria group bacterium]|nr:MerR family transcriptional regulator [Patescibacteria group bacterium]